MRPAPKVIPVVRELVGAVLDALARRVPDVEPIVFDQERADAWRDMVETATVTRGRP